ncbi:hypothetical protein K3718_20085 (plasmid) [Leisingera aquaemixtae]|uniref:Uncharacterized protein n=1 Tax=Leisingera aquaemixtae TaxID=1396826 RepID=A0ABY5WQN8_9RHOB|nr:hypothetical protein [Leisingera aquaemixtae]UWQ43778.1 hypothetical protein K3718_20085 [Leisingera aquaemixtae]
MIDFIDAILPKKSAAKNREIEIRKPIATETMGEKLKNNHRINAAIHIAQTDIKNEGIAMPDLEPGASDTLLFRPGLRRQRRTGVCGKLTLPEAAVQDRILHRIGVRAAGSRRSAPRCRWQSQNR